MTKCTPDKIENPSTGRCILTTGKTYKKLVSDGTLVEDPDRALNPLTGRLILKSGATYKKLVASGTISVKKDKSPVKSPTKSPAKKSPTVSLSNAAKSPVKSPAKKTVTPKSTPTPKKSSAKKMIPNLDDDSDNESEDSESMQDMNPNFQDIAIKLNGLDTKISKDGYMYCYLAVETLISKYGNVIVSENITNIDLNTAKKIVKKVIPESYSEYIIKYVDDVRSKKDYSLLSVTKVKKIILHNDRYKNAVFTIEGLRCFTYSIEYIIMECLAWIKGEITPNKIIKFISTEQDLKKLLGKVYIEYLKWASKTPNKKAHILNIPKTAQIKQQMNKYFDNIAKKANNGSDVKMSKDGYEYCYSITMTILSYYGEKLLRLKKRAANISIIKEITDELFPSNRDQTNLADIDEYSSNIDSNKLSQIMPNKYHCVSISIQVFECIGNVIEYVLNNVLSASIIRNYGKTITYKMMNDSIMKNPKLKKFFNL